MSPPQQMPGKDASVPPDSKHADLHLAASQIQGEVEEAAHKTPEDDNLDEAAKYLANASAGQYAPLTADREKMLRKKIDSWMIPLVRAYSHEYICKDKVLLTLTRNSFCLLPRSELWTKLRLAQLLCTVFKQTTTCMDRNIAGWVAYCLSA